MPTFTISDRINANLSYASDITCQPPGHSKCDKICDSDKKKKRKTTNFKTISPYTTDFSYINIFR